MVEGEDNPVEIVQVTHGRRFVLGEAGVLEGVLWFLPTLGLNMVGGLVLVTLLRLVRTKELLEERRGSGPRLRRD